MTCNTTYSSATARIGVPGTKLDSSGTAPRSPEKYPIPYHQGLRDHPACLQTHQTQSQPWFTERSDSSVWKFCWCNPVVRLASRPGLGTTPCHRPQACRPFLFRFYLADKLDGRGCYLRLKLWTLPLFEQASLTLTCYRGLMSEKRIYCLMQLLYFLYLLLFPHISPISRTRGHRRRLPFPYHRYIQKTQTKEEKERKKITDEKTSPDLIGGEGKK